MPVDTKHPDYVEMESEWQKCRDVTDGTKAVKAAGETYLPKLEGQTDPDYDGYKLRAPFYNATSRTIQALNGLIFRKDEDVELPGAMAEWQEDISLSGQTLKEFAMESMENFLQVGRHGILVDFPAPEEDGDDAKPMTQAALEEKGLRPYMVPYVAESIINWRYERVGSTMLLTRVVLRETYLDPEDSDGDEFTERTLRQYRVLDLYQGPLEMTPEVEVTQLSYRVRVYKEVVETRGPVGINTGDTKQFELKQEYLPLVNNEPLGEIPFEIIPRPEISKPPLLDMVEVNLTNYRTGADVKHGEHFTGLPVYYGIGDDDETKITVGSSNWIMFPSNITSVGILEFQGKGLGELKDSLDREEKQMAALGARMLMPEKAAAESGIAEQIRRSGENSSLARYANLVSKGIKRSLERMAEWAGISGQIDYGLNTDYLPASMDAQMLTALSNSYLSNTIPVEVLYHNLQRGEMLPDGLIRLEPEEFKQLLEDSVSELPGGNPQGSTSFE